MDPNALRSLLAPYNPWWDSAVDWRGQLPAFERPIVRQLEEDLRQVPQIVSLTGPRRVGKSTALRHVVSHLHARGIDPASTVYFSFDDPALFVDPVIQRRIFDLLMAEFVRDDRDTYFFLDEIQRLPKWELFLKKAYDTKLRARFVVSGSASSPIFRHSHESLLGRIKDRRLLPFSFREYAAYRLRERAPGFATALGNCPDLRGALLSGDIDHATRTAMDVQSLFAPHTNDLNDIVRDFCAEGGFPEVWELTDPVRKIEYLMEQQVRKVLYEDLTQIAEYRKPENVLRLFLYLLAHPGLELNVARVSKDAQLERRVIDENLPRLELTDLVVRIHKFRHQPLRVRASNVKCYPIDLALRNAVLKTWGPPDQQTMGYYAEGLVVRTLLEWKEALELSYYREGHDEIDFVVTYGGTRHLPIEVKQRTQEGSLAALRAFRRKYDVPIALGVTRSLDVVRDDVLRVPLRYFLLAA